MGGLWEVGDTHVSIPWNDLKFSKDGSRITVPITEDTVDDYSAAAAQPGALHKKEAGQVATVEEDLATGPQLIKATDIIGDTAFLNNAERYGYISDIRVNDGRLAAVVADTRIYGRGYRAFPYAGPAAWASGSGRYELGYGVAEVRQLENFDYSRMLYKGPTEHAAKSSTDNAPGQLDRPVMNAPPTVPRSSVVLVTDRTTTQRGRLRKGARSENLAVSDLEFFSESVIRIG